VGEPRSHGRATVLVDGMERVLSRRHFEILLLFSRKPWVALTEVGGNIDTARIEILRLRRRLSEALGLRREEILASDGQKRYRLLVPVQVRRKTVRRHQPDLAT
jgi:hypothetical protein